MLSWCRMISWILLFFFFQAEDGIRDVAVTGVQTCALPISLAVWSSRRGATASGSRRGAASSSSSSCPSRSPPWASRWRSMWRRAARWACSCGTCPTSRGRVSLVEPPICERCGSVLLLQAKHVAYARVVRHAHADVALILSCPTCRSEGAMLVGPDAQAALRQGLTYLALARGSRQRVED